MFKRAEVMAELYHIVVYKGKGKEPKYAIYLKYLVKETELAPELMQYME